MIDLKAGDRFAAVAPSLNLVGTWKESGGVVNSSTPAVATTTVVMTIVLVIKIIIVYISLSFGNIR